MPAVREDVAPRDLALGVRPEHIRFDDDSTLRGAVYGTEYLGTTQIVTVNTPFGQVKARLPVDRRSAAGENVGLRLPPTGCPCSTRQAAGRCARRLYEGAAHG